MNTTSNRKRVLIVMTATNGVIKKEYINGYLYKWPDNNPLLNASEVMSTYIGNIVGIDVVQNSFKSYNGTCLVVSKLYNTNGDKYIPIEKYNGDIKDKVGIGNMIIFDYVIRNIDRHGKNIEINTRTGKLSPLFDQGLSLLSTVDDIFLKEVPIEDRTRVNNYFGFDNLYGNLYNIEDFSCNLDVIINLSKFSSVLGKRRTYFVENMVNSRLKFLREYLR